MQHWNLKGKTALITGASTGIGKAIHEEFIKLGARTIIVARSSEKLREIADQHPGQCLAFCTDLSEEAGILKLMDFIENEVGVLDILVNNAGRNLRKPTDEYSLDDLRKVIALNAEAAFLICQMSLPLLRKSSAASVINISSITSFQVVQTSTAAYHMSKGALDQLTRFLACEWGKDNIRVNALHPWYIATPLGEEILKDEQKRERIEQATPLRRVGQAAEVARAAAFLAMEASSYISGAQIPIDGGFSKAGLSFED